MWVDFAVQILAKVQRLHILGHLDFFNWTKLPSGSIPLACENVQDLGLVIESWFVLDQFVWLIDLHVELLLVEELQVLHHGVVVDDVSKVVPRGPHSKPINV